jgi:phenylalanyl-tRNA synthetase beta chain
VKLPIAWLRDFVDLTAGPALIAERLAACGFEVASIDADAVDFEITANRPDCLTISGLAREVATAFDVEIKAPGLGPRASGDNFDLRTSKVDVGRSGSSPQPQPIPVTIENTGCGRYALAVVDVGIAPSPSWLADRLLAAGIRPINNVVDVTNYVMLELHPMHAFDAAKLAGPEIRVRLARAGEKLETLDGQTRTLDASMLVVADRDQPVAIAGIMGGANSEVSNGTTRVALESAWWEPVQVRRTGRQLSLKTEAGARFERGADIDAPARAVERALALLNAIGATRAAVPVLDVFPRPVPRLAVDLRRDHLDRLLGDKVPDADVERILTRLGFGVTKTAAGWRMEVPTFRVDVRREADLIEEVGRHWGFDRIPATFPALRSAPPPAAPSISHGRTVRRLLTGAGLQEAMTFTFIEQAAAASFVAIANPLSEKFAVLRPSLLPGLLDALIYSRRRETADVRLFEAGSVFGPGGERQAVGWVMTGSRADHWSGGGDRLDFFDAKGAAELLVHAFGATVDTEVIELPWLVPGRTAQLLASGPARSTLGVIGQIRPEIAASRGLGDGDAIVAGEIDLAALVAAGGQTDRRVVPLPRYPSIVRDLSILVDERLPAASVRGTIRASAPGTLVEVREFDRYQGRGVPDGRVSLSVRLTFRAADRTLTDAEVQRAVDAIVEALARDHGAALRGSSD